MKIFLTFSMPREFNPYMNPYDGFTTTAFELPDEAAEHPNAEELVLASAQAIGTLTQAKLSVTCTPLDIKERVIKDPRFEELDQKTQIEIARLLITFAETIVWFSYKPHDSVIRQLRIAAPIPSSLPKVERKMRMTKRGHFVPDKRPLSLSHSMRRPDLSNLAQYDQVRQSYYGYFVPLAESFIPLLNMNSHLNDWKFQGVCPEWYNEAQAVRADKRHRASQRKAEQEAAKQAKLEAKRLALTEKMAVWRQESDDSNIAEPMHGAGRTIGARPGIYKGVQMRSQLEIRIASELDERKIRWIYEAEALGDAGYLVDFYLPDIGAWVEVKGRLEARDRQVLPQIAYTLKHDRQQKLLMYTSSGPCFVINPSGFREIERKNFWVELFK